MNRVTRLNHNADGEMLTTPEGEFLAVDAFQWATQPLINLLHFNRNGSLANTVATGFEDDRWLLYSVLPNPGNYRIPTYQIFLQGSNRVCTSGPHIFSFTEGSTSDADSAFSGCLSDRSLMLAASAKQSGARAEIVGNPVQDFLYVRNTFPGEVAVDIMNVQGKQMKTGLSPYAPIYVGNFASGIYQLRLRDAEGNAILLRFQKE